MVVHLREIYIFEWQMTQALDGGIGRQTPAFNILEKFVQGIAVHARFSIAEVRSHIAELKPSASSEMLIRKAFTSAICNLTSAVPSVTYRRLLHWFSDLWTGCDRPPRDL